MSVAEDAVVVVGVYVIVLSVLLVAVILGGCASILRLATSNE